VAGFGFPSVQTERHTKVNRCLTEGRRAFTGRVREIEEGGECARLAPALSALADGEGTADEAKVLRRHLRGCPACRATLGEFRAAPGQVAALVPPVLATLDRGDGPARGLAALGDWLQERLAALGLKFHGVSEMASAHKVAAVTASTAAIAGGGVGVVATYDELREPNERPSVHRVGPASRATAASSLAPEVVRRYPARAAVLHEVRREHAQARRLRTARSARPSNDPQSGGPSSSTATHATPTSAPSGSSSSSPEFGIERHSTSSGSGPSGAGAEFSGAPRSGGSQGSAGSEFTFESSAPARPSSSGGGGEFSP